MNTEKEKETCHCLSKSFRNNGGEVGEGTTPRRFRQAQGRRSRRVFIGSFGHLCVGCLWNSIAFDAILGIAEQVGSSSRGTLTLLLALSQ